MSASAGRIGLDDKVVHEISVPRDTKYDFWGEYNKLNQMLTWVGVEAQVQAVSQVFGMPIDYYAIIGLDSFVALGDNFGGVEANLPYAITYSFYTHDFADESYDAGQQLLTGWRAMALSRARTGYGKSGLVVGLAASRAAEADGLRRNHMETATVTTCTFLGAEPSRAASGSQKAQPLPGSRMVRESAMRGRCAIVLLC